MKFPTRTLVAIVSLAVMCGCKTGSAAPDAVDEDPTAILDAPIPQSQRPKKSKSKESSGPMMLLPETPAKPSIDIDAKDSDWDGKKFRTFRTKSSVEDGLQYWSGRSDASMRVAIDADAGFVYAYIEVTDDRVVETPMGGKPADGIVLWLRDPGLDALGRALPPSVGLDAYVDAETAILFLPNGRVEAIGDRDEIDFNETMLHEVVQGKNGYTIEVALKIEAFEEIASLPLSQIAFRVELLDGDDEDRPGVQTKMSTTPNRGDDSPRFASLDVGGVLPHLPVGGPPPRAQAIGRWRVEDGKWKFAAFEVIPKYWKALEDTEGFEATLRDADTLSDVCGVARKDIHLVEAYESKGGGFRAGLVLCGERAVRDKCPTDARSSILLVSLRPDGEEQWAVESSIEVFDKPSNQCTYQPVSGEPFYQHLALFPVDVLSSSVWAVGWTRTTETRSLVEERSGITLLNTKFEVPNLGTTTTAFRRMTPSERTISESSVYLTYVDEDDNVDICQIENLVEQACDSLDRGCVTYEHGRTRLTHIQMWSKKQRRFERYELSKHPGCRATFDFSGSQGYLVLQMKDRIGLLPSPKTNDGADGEKLDLF